MTSLTLDIRQVGKERQIVEVSNGSVFIKMGEWSYYIDNSTGEEIIKRWKTDDNFRSVDDYDEEPTWNRQTEYHN